MNESLLRGRLQVRILPGSPAFGGEYPERVVCFAVTMGKIKCAGIRVSHSSAQRERG